MEFSREEYQSGLPFPSPGDAPNWGIKSRSSALQADSFIIWAPREAQVLIKQTLKIGMWLNKIPENNCEDTTNEATACEQSNEELTLLQLLTGAPVQRGRNSDSPLSLDKNPGKYTKPIKKTIWNLSACSYR